MAFLAAVGQLRLPCAGAAASRQALVSRLGRRIYQTINIIEDVQPDIVVIVGADHVYRMDFQQMVQQHIESGAEFTVAASVSPSASPTSSV